MNNHLFQQFWPAHSPFPPTAPWLASIVDRYRLSLYLGLHKFSSESSSLSNSQNESENGEDIDGTTLESDSNSNESPGDTPEGSGTAPQQVAFPALEGQVAYPYPLTPPTYVFPWNLTSDSLVEIAKSGIRLNLGRTYYRLVPDVLAINSSQINQRINWAIQNIDRVKSYLNTHPGSYSPGLGIWIINNDIIFDFTYPLVYDMNGNQVIFENLPSESAPKEQTQTPPDEENSNSSSGGWFQSKERKTYSQDGMNIPGVKGDEDDESDVNPDYNDPEYDPDKDENGEIRYPPWLEGSYIYDNYNNQNIKNISIFYSSMRVIYKRIYGSYI